MPSLSIKQKSLLLLALFVTFTVASCVSIPQQTELIQRGCGQLATQTLATADNSQQTQGKPQFALPVTGLNSESFSILNWNIYKGQQINWDRDLTRLSADKDIVLLQEASLNAKLLDVLSAQNFCWWFNNAFLYGGVETGVMVASKTPPINSYGLRHAEPLIRIPKTILINRYALSGAAETLLVANIHGINFTLGTSSYRQQLQEMQKILSRHTGPLIVAGDFNNWSDQRTKVLNEMAAVLSLTQLRYQTSNQTSRFDHKIDHIFYRGLEPLSSASLQVSSSDHNPLTAQFRVINKQRAQL